MGERSYSETWAAAALAGFIAPVVALEAFADDLGGIAGLVVGGGSSPPVVAGIGAAHVVVTAAAYWVAYGILDALWFTPLYTDELRVAMVLLVAYLAAWFLLAFGLACWPIAAAYALAGAAGMYRRLDQSSEWHW